MTACAKPNAGFTHALEISQRQRDSHIPTTPATILPKHKGKDQNQELSMGAVEKWKSKSRISTFPPPAQPAARGKFPFTAPPGQRDRQARGFADVSSSELGCVGLLAAWEPCPLCTR